LKNQPIVSPVREAHSYSPANTNCTLNWNIPFDDVDYSFFVNGFDSIGNALEITFVSKNTTSIVFKTFIAGNLMAIAVPQTSLPT
ncbi:MAG: hypothetical protein NTW16_07030, partial [Bacteroidetes bacterium]|nr:hypothetical protein [Bacteroidota bacterium]